MSVMAACDSCRYFSPATNRGDDADGTCHRHAPTQLTLDPVQEDGESGIDDNGNEWHTLTLTTGTTYTGWPDVHRSDWCGEFSP